MIDEQHGKRYWFAADTPAAASFRRPARLDIEFRDVTFTYAGALHPASSSAADKINLFMISPVLSAV